MGAMENELRSDLERLVDAYAGAVGKARTTIAHAAIGSDRFFTRLDGGGTFTVRVYDAAVRWFAERWPAHLAWPEGVARPVVPAPAEAGGEGGAAVVVEAVTAAPAPAGGAA